MLKSTRIKDSAFGKYVQESMKYPPSELFGDNQSPTPKEKKLEQRCIQLCESVFNINNFLLSEMRNSWREVQNMYVFSKNIKTTYCVSVVARFEAVFKMFDREYENAVKQEPALKEYYSKFKLSSDDKTKLFAMLLDDTNEISLNILPQYKEDLKAETTRLNEIKAQSKK